MTPSRQRTIFVVTALGAFMASLDLSIVNVAFPALEHSFPHDSRATLAWVITGYGIVFGSLLVTAGRTADRLGSRRVFFAGLGVFCLGSALCALAPSVPCWCSAGWSRGWGRPALLPSSLGLLLGAYPHERRSQVVALWGGVGALAVATGPSFGAALIAAGGWRWVFVVNVPIGVVAWLVGRRVLAEPATGAARAAPDYLGRGADQRGAGRPGPGHLRGTDLGMVLGRGAWPASPAPSSWAWPSSAAPAAIPSRCSTSPCSGPGPSAWPTPPPSSTPWASSPCCWATSCS